MRIAPLLVSITLAIPVLGATPSNWLLPVTGNWTDASKWSTDPSYPTNGNPAGSSYDATVAATGGSYTVTLSNDTSLNSLTLNSSTATVKQTAGVLNVATLNILAGTYSLQAGTVRNALIQDTGSAGKFSVGTSNFTSTLDHVTLGMDMSAPGPGGGASVIAVRNGLTLSNHNINFLAGSFMEFFDSQPLGGTGEVVVDNRPSSSGFSTNLYAPTGTFYIASGVTVRTGASGTGTSEGITLGAGITGTQGLFENYGAISAQTDGMSVEIKGDWVNHGTIKLSAGLLKLGGRFTPASIGTFVRTGGSVVLNGKVTATGQTLLLDQTTGSWDFGDGFAGSIIGGRVEAHDGTNLHIGASDEPKLDGVTLAAPILMDHFSNLDLANSLTLDGGSIAMTSGNSETSPSILKFTNATSVSGTGDILFEGGKTFNIMNPAGAVSFGSGVTIRADTGGAFIRAITSAPITINGDIISGPAARQITLTGPITMNGHLQIDAGGTVPILGLTNLASNTLSGGSYFIDTGSSLRISQAITQSSASIALNGANSNVFVGSSGSVDALGGLTNINVGGGLSLTGGRSLTLNNPVQNDGNIVVGAGSTLAVPGGLTVNAGASLSGDGVISGSVTSGGVIQPDPVDAAPNAMLLTPPAGDLSILGDLTLVFGSELQFELSPSYTDLDVTGLLTASGALNALLASGFDPLIGSEFDLLDFGSLSGTFSSVTLPSLSGDRSWDTTNLYTAGKISVVPEPAGPCWLLGLLACNTIRRRRPTVSKNG